MVLAWQGRPPCAAFIGVGHTHRGTGELEKRALRHSSERRLDFSGAISSTSRIMGGATLPRTPAEERQYIKREYARTARRAERAGRGRRLAAARYNSSAAAGRASRGASGEAGQGSSPFQFGFRYSHFFYTMMPHPPFRILATSNEFCIGSAQDARDCESVQFISGIEVEHAADDAANGAEERLLMSYGINDCEARLAKMSMSHVWAMLRPLKGEANVCSVASVWARR